MPRLAGTLAPVPDGESHCGSAGASPSQNKTRATGPGRARLWPSRVMPPIRGTARLRPSRIMPRLAGTLAPVPDGESHCGSAGASPSQNKTRATDPGRARLRPSWVMPRLAGRLAPVPAGEGHCGSAGASPSQNKTRAADPGRARLWPSRITLRLAGTLAPVPDGESHCGSAGASPSRNKTSGHRSWEGEAPAEPANATAAQRELRPPENKTSATEPGRARLRPSRQRYCGSAGASPSRKPGPPNLGGRGSGRAGEASAAQRELRPPKQNLATEPGRARLRPSRIMPRLAGRLEPAKATAAQRELRPPKTKPGPPILGGRGSGRAG